MCNGDSKDLVFKKVIRFCISITILSHLAVLGLSGIFLEHEKEMHRDAVVIQVIIKFNLPAF